MGNIKKFEEFNLVNEGLISWASKTFKPGELDGLIDDIIQDIVYYFNIDGLEYLSEKQSHPDFNVSGTSYHIYGYHYTNNKGDIIRVNYNALYINDENVTELVNKHYISELWDFFTKKYNNKDNHIKRQQNTEKVRDIRNKYSNKYNPKGYID